MLKLKIHWELETGEVYEEWTRPYELAQAINFVYFWDTKFNNVSQRKLKTLKLGKQKSPILQLLILRQQILPSPNSRANSSRISNNDWYITRLLAQRRTRYLGYGYRHIKRAQ